MVRTRDKPWSDDLCALIHRAKQRKYRVWSHSRTQADWEENRAARRVPSWSIEMLNELSGNVANHS